MTTRCRHSTSWLIANALYEWCYRCGAFRQLRHTNATDVAPTTPWCKPTGPEGENPFDSWTRARATYNKLHRK